MDFEFLFHHLFVEQLLHFSYLIFLILSVGYHRYTLENFNSDSLDGLVEHEVQEFDPPSEVSIIF